MKSKRITNDRKVRIGARLANDIVVYLGQFFLHLNGLFELNGKFRAGEIAPNPSDGRPTRWRCYEEAENKTNASKFSVCCRGNRFDHNSSKSTNFSASRLSRFTAQRDLALGAKTKR